MAKAPVKTESKDVARPEDAFSALRAEVDRLFDDFGRKDFGFGRSLFSLEPFKGVAPSFGAKMPVVNVSETDTAYEITAELPGIDEKDVEVSLADGVLTVKGEKKEEREEKEKNHYLSERTFGAFQRSFRLPENADDKKISADVAKGVLTVKIAKKAPAKKAEKERKIKVTSR
ncbi:MAG: Hsp20/alpha crystallin family protein [Alphaproteobacteria bacterium]|nr:Hsp20/alpha crystallin family protein [Alphaproteobacteria bacterium]